MFIVEEEAWGQQQSVINGPNFKNKKLSGLISPRVFMHLSQLSQKKKKMHLSQECALTSLLFFTMINQNLYYITKAFLKDFNFLENFGR